MKKYTEPNVIIDSGNMHEERRWAVAVNANAIYNANAYRNANVHMNANGNINFNLNRNMNWSKS